MLDDIFEIIDLNKNNLESKKNFSALIRRCDEVEHRLAKYFSICDQFKVTIPKFSDFIAYKLSCNQFDVRMDTQNKIGFDFIESEVNKIEKLIEELFSNFNSIDEDLEILYEKREVWCKLNDLFMKRDSSLIPIENRIG